MSTHTTASLPFDAATHVLVVDEVGYLSYGPDAANVLFHVVNERHLRGRSMLFTTNKSPLTAWGAVLHDTDLAEAIVYRILERGRLMLLGGPSYRTQHLDLDVDGAELAHDEPARISGKHRPALRIPLHGSRWIVDRLILRSVGLSTHTPPPVSLAHSHPDCRATDRAERAR